MPEQHGGVLTSRTAWRKEKAPNEIRAANAAWTGAVALLHCLIYIHVFSEAEVIKTCHFYLGNDFKWGWGCKKKKNQSKKPRPGNQHTAAITAKRFGLYVAKQKQNIWSTWNCCWVIGWKVIRPFKGSQSVLLQIIWRFSSKRRWNISRTKMERTRKSANSLVGNGKWCSY